MHSANHCPCPTPSSLCETLAKSSHFRYIAAGESFDGPDSDLILPKVSPFIFIQPFSSKRYRSILSRPLKTSDTETSNHGITDESCFFYHSRQSTVGITHQRNKWVVYRAEAEGHWRNFEPKRQNLPCQHQPWSQSTRRLVTKIPGILFFVPHPSPCGMHQRKAVGLPRSDQPMAVAGRASELSRQAQGGGFT